MKRKASPESLTEDEIEFLRSERAASSVRSFVARQHETVGVRSSAYRKVAAAARAEREAIMEIAALQVTRVAADNSVNAEGRVKQLEDEQTRLERELEATRTRLTLATANGALAVHSEPSR